MDEKQRKHDKNGRMLSANATLRHGLVNLDLCYKGKGVYGGVVHVMSKGIAKQLLDGLTRVLAEKPAEKAVEKKDEKAAG